MRRLLVGLALAAVALAGALSYLADGDPDGLDAATQRGCTVADDTGELTGECAARGTTDHALDDGPLADYTVGGDARLTGVAGVLGVAVTFAAAGGLFWLLRRRAPGPAASGGPAASDAPVTPDVPPRDGRG